MAPTHGLTTKKRSHLTIARIRGGGPASAAGLGMLLPSQVAPASSPLRDGVPGAASTAVRRSPVTPAEAARRPALLATPQLDERGRAQLTLVGRALGWEAGGTVAATADADAGVLRFGDLGPGVHRTLSARFDGQGRLHLSAGMRAALGVSPGAQLLVAVDPEARTATVRSAGGALEVLLAPSAATGTVAGAATQPLDQRIEGTPA